jgi:hypothetical protein
MRGLLLMRLIRPYAKTFFGGAVSNPRPYRDAQPNSLLNNPVFSLSVSEFWVIAAS